MGPPEVVRVKRLVKQWQAASGGYEVPRGYWDNLAGTKGNNGRISRMRHTLEKRRVSTAEARKTGGTGGIASQCGAMTGWLWKLRMQ